MNEITAAIKAKAFDYAKALYTHAKDEDIRESSQFEAYTCGGEDAIGFMLKFIHEVLWKHCDKNHSEYLKEIQDGKLWHDGAKNHFSTEELLKQFLEDNKL